MIILFQDFFDQIENGRYVPIDDNIFDTIVAEGWDETTGIGIKRMYDYIILEINCDEEQGLMNFDKDTVEKFNKFDIALKDMYGVKKYIDLVDYDAGVVRIVRNRSAFVRCIL